jgi:carboxymethylenebutenolidase
VPQTSVALCSAAQVHHIASLLPIFKSSSQLSAILCLKGEITMKPLGKFEKYLIEEFYDDYREGLLSRRSFIRRVAFITGSMASAAAAMIAVGCQPIEVPAADAPMPEAETPEATEEPAEEAVAGAVPGAKSPLSVPEGDPDVATEMVTFDNQGSEIGGYLAQPAVAGVYPAVLVCHENRGLTPHIKDVARRYAKEGYVALALDLLWREGGTDAINFDEAPGLLTNAGIERHVGDFAAAFGYVQGLESVDPERIAMTGFCFGGGVTWTAATALPELKAAAPYYGPAPDLEAVPNIKAAVFGVYAEQDERINAGIEPLRAALDAAGITYQIKIYPGVNHAFHNDTGERYNEEQALQAWHDTLAWFAEYV